MNHELFVARREKSYRKLSDRVLFDIRKFNWNPSYETLEKFCEDTYYSIVEKYEELEETQEFIFTGEILYAIDRSKCTDLVFVVGEGATTSESAATHSLGWGLKELLEKQKINPKPFDFKLLIVGCEGSGEGDDGDPMPVLDEVINF